MSYQRSARRYPPWSPTAILCRINCVFLVRFSLQGRNVMCLNSYFYNRLDGSKSTSHVNKLSRWIDQVNISIKPTSTTDYRIKSSNNEAPGALGAYFKFRIRLGALILGGALISFFPNLGQTVIYFCNIIFARKQHNLNRWLYKMTSEKHDQHNTRLLLSRFLQEKQINQIIQQVVISVPTHALV